MKAIPTVLAVFAAGVALSQESGDADRGGELYLAYACYSCHGYGGTGRVPLSREASGILSAEATFLTYLRLRADQNPVNPRSTMPSYSVAALSDEHARDIYAYLISLDDEPPALEDIPAFTEILDDAKRRTAADADDQ